MKRAVRALAVAASLAVSCASCLSLTWERQRAFSPPPEGVLEQLRPEQSELEEALRLLGAPLWVREHEIEGAQVVWGWLDEREWTGRVSVAVTDNASASFQYGDLARKMRGAVLVFDPEWKLRLVRRGWLADILPPRVQPSVPDLDSP